MLRCRSILVNVSMFSQWLFGFHLFSLKKTSADTSLSVSFSSSSCHISNNSHECMDGNVRSGQIVVNGKVHLWKYQLPVDRFYWLMTGLFWIEKSLLFSCEKYAEFPLGSWRNVSVGLLFNQKHHHRHHHNHLIKRENFSPSHKTTAMICYAWEMKTRLQQRRRRGGNALKTFSISTWTTYSEAFEKN